MKALNKLFGIKPKVDEFALESAKIELSSATDMLDHVIFDCGLDSADADNLLQCAFKVASLMKSQGQHTVKLNHSKSLTLEGNFLTISTTNT